MRIKLIQKIQNHFGRFVLIYSTLALSIGIAVGFNYWISPLRALQTAAVVFAGLFLLALGFAVLAYYCFWE